MTMERAYRNLMAEVQVCVKSRTQFLQLDLPFRVIPSLSERRTRVEVVEAIESGG